MAGGQSCANRVQHIERLRHGYTGCKRTGFVKPDSLKLANGHVLHDEAGPWNRALQTPVPPWIQGLVRRVLCIGWSMAIHPLSATAVPLHLTQFAVPFVQIVATVCLQGTWFYTIFLWQVQCMVHGSQALGWFNPLFFEPVGTSPQPSIWLRQVGLLSSQSEPWVDATCFLKIEHPGCAESQALANHRCSVEHVLLHALVKYRIQLALQNTLSTLYNRIVWALSRTACHVLRGAKGQLSY